MALLSAYLRTCGLKEKLPFKLTKSQNKKGTVPVI